MLFINTLPNYRIRGPIVVYTPSSKDGQTCYHYP